MEATCLGEGEEIQSGGSRSTVEMLTVISADVKQERSMGMRVSETMTKESF